MSNSLYFIPLLFNALENVDVNQSLRQALRTIVLLGQDERFREGYEQFIIFMDAVFAAHRQDASETETASTDGADGAADLLDELAGLSDLAAVWDNVKHDLGLEPSSEFHVAFLLRRNEEPPRSVQLSREERKGIIRGILPGAYELSLSSGRIIWETILTKEDLLSAYAFPEEPLRLAADTADGHREEPTGRMELLDGEVTVSVFAGPANGRMEIEW